MKPSSKASGRKQLTIELPERSAERLENLATILDCSKVAVIQRAINLLTLAAAGNLCTKDGREIIVL